MESMQETCRPAAGVPAPDCAPGRVLAEVTARRTRASVETFLAALARGDRAVLRGTLTAGPFHFEGAVDRFDDVDTFLADIENYALILTAVECRRLFVDGREACVVLDYRTCFDNLARTRAVAWVATDAVGRICRIENFLDPRAYARMFVVGGRRGID